MSFRSEGDEFTSQHCQAAMISKIVSCVIQTSNSTGLCVILYIVRYYSGLL